MPISLDGSGSISGISTFSFSEKIIHTGDTNTSIKFPAADTITFETSGSERFRITSAGKIGIGTDLPQEELTIRSSTPALMLRDTDQEGSYTQVSNANQDMYFSANGTSAHANFIFRSGNAGSFLERLRITSDGKIGIGGESSPEFKVTVYDAGYSGVTIKSNRSSAADNIGGLHFKTQSTNVAYIQSLVDGTIKFRNTSSLTERLRIQSDGKVGIGTHTAYNALDVLGSSADILIYDTDAYSENSNGAALSLQGNDSAGNRKTLADVRGVAKGANVGEFAIRTRRSGGNLTEAFRITSGGSFGFNNNNPQYTLDIVGNQINLQSNASASNAVVRLRGQNNSTGGAIVAMNGSGGAGPLEFWTGSSQRLQITSTGYVNIGGNLTQTDSRAHIQDVTRPLQEGTLTLSSASTTNGAANNGSTLRFHGHDGSTERYQASIRGAKENGTSGNYAGYLAFNTRPHGSGMVERLRITSVGHVTKPHHACFQATRNGASHIQLASHPNSDVVFTSVDFDQGNNYNNTNGRFTAPVAAKYYFGIQFYCGFSVTSVRVMHAYWKVNGSNSHSADLFGGIGNFSDPNMNHYHPTTNAHVMLNLAAGDYVTFNTGSSSFIGSGNTYLYGTKGTRFFGYLVA